MNHMLENKRILIIVTGSIASYKSLYLIRLLKEAKAKVTVVMTKSAKKFIKLCKTFLSDILAALRMRGRRPPRMLLYNA